MTSLTEDMKKARESIERQRRVHEAINVIEKELELQRWIQEIPFIELPEGFLIKPIPSHRGCSIARFLVKKKGGREELSVYLDCYDTLGFYGEPYWEIYPHKDDTFRCKMMDTKSLVNAIVDELTKLCDINKEKFVKGCK